MSGWTVSDSAHQSPAAQPERRSDAFTIDFLATTDDGRPVRDLKASEVTVKIDGRTRAVRTLELVSLAAFASVAETAHASTLPPPFVTSTAAGSGRTIFIVLDEDSLQTGKEQALRAAVDRFVAALSPDDSVALLTAPYGGVKVPLTTDHARVARTLLTLSGQASRDESGSERACRTRRVLESLAGLLGTLGAQDGPVTIVFVTSGLAGPRRDAPITLAPGMCELTVAHFEAVAVAAGRARANFYVVQPDDVLGTPVVQENIAGAGFLGSDSPLEGIEHLSGVTNAARLHLGSSDDALGRVVRETSAYYVATLVPDRSDRDGRSHQLDVRVNRAGVLVRSRPRLTVATLDTRAAAVRRVTAREMLVVSNGFGDVALRAAGYVSQNAGDGRLKIVSVAEPIDPALRFASVATALVDPDGRVVAQSSVSDVGVVPIATAMIVPPGAYRLRVAATDAEGRGGTADYNMIAELVPAGPLKLSSLVLGLSRSGGFLPKLQFGPEPVALGSLEIYGGTPGIRVSASLDVATTLDGPALLAVPLAIEAAGKDRYLATGAVPIGALPAGDFVVRATVTVEGQPSGRVVRTLRKVIP